MKPMLAQPLRGLPDGDGFVMEPKLDGWRCVAHVEADGVELYTRTQNRIDQVPYIEAQIAKLFPVGSIIDGELTSPVSDGIEGWGNVQHIARSHAIHDPANPKDRLIYVVFDVVQLGSQTLARESLLTRRKALVKTLKNRRGIVRAIEQTAVSVEQHEAWLAHGYEGSVVKKLTSRYRTGSRSGGWYKVKPQVEDVEATCIGFYASEPGSKYDGVAVGGVRFLLPNGYEGRAAGMADAERIAMFDAWQNGGEDRWTGCVIELAHHGVTQDGALRHPQYKRVRDPKDKSIADERGSIMPTATKVKAPRVSAGVRMRNYNAMKDAKLLGCIADLQDRAGDAYERCVGKGGDPEADLRVARSVAEQRGLR